MAHVLGILAVATFLLSFQFKTRRNILAVNLLSRALYIIQYILLGAFEGAVLDFSGFVLSFFARFKETEKVKKYFPVIITLVNVLLLIIGLVMYEDVFTLFAIAGIILEVSALWLTKEKNIRILTLFSAPCWFAYNFANHAYGSVVGNVLLVISVVVAMWRLDFKKMKG